MKDELLTERWKKRANVDTIIANSQKFEERRFRQKKKRERNGMEKEREKEGDEI